MPKALIIQGTPTATDTQPAFESTRTLSEVVHGVGILRDDMRLLAEDLDDMRVKARDAHQSAYTAQVSNLAQELVRRPVVELLDELAALGFAWRAIARVVGVSVPAVRRWRQGEAATGANRLAVASFLSLAKVLAEQPVDDVASWLEIPLVAGVPVTGIDLLASGRAVEVCELFAQHVTGEQLLDECQPDWRVRYQSGYEVFEASDGELALRPKSEG